METSEAKRLAPSIKNLLVEEMKRAIQIIEDNPELSMTKQEVATDHMDREYKYTIHNSEMSELKSILREVRRHSVIVGKSLKYD